MGKTKVLRCSELCIVDGPNEACCGEWALFNGTMSSRFPLAWREMLASNETRCTSQATPPAFAEGFTKLAPTVQEDSLTDFLAKQLCTASRSAGTAGLSSCDDVCANRPFGLNETKNPLLPRGSTDALRRLRRALGLRSRRDGGLPLNGMAFSPQIGAPLSLHQTDGWKTK
jgi:hypothetical protein